MLCVRLVFACNWSSFKRQITTGINHVYIERFTNCIANGRVRRKRVLRKFHTKCKKNSVGKIEHKTKDDEEEEEEKPHANYRKSWVFSVGKQRTHST